MLLIKSLQYRSLISLRAVREHYVGLAATDFLDRL